MKYKIIVVLVMLALLVNSSCKKLVEVEGPKTSVNSANIYKKDNTATSVLTSIYAKMSSTGIQTASLSGICFFTGLSSDELVFVGSGNDQYSAYFTNNLNSQFYGYQFWNNIYTELYVINSALEGILASNSLTPAVKNQLLGEAKFMRAFCFFYLVNLYGDVPLVVSTDYKNNLLLPRAPSAEVWEQIIADLKDAQQLLNENYLDATLLNVTTERVRPTKAAATALLARSYLYSKEWSRADEEATTLINNSNYNLVQLDKVFLKNSKEAIWQLQPVRRGENSQEAIGFQVWPLNPTGTTVFLSESLTRQFEIGDQRKSNWVNTINIAGTTYSFANKYKKRNFTNDVNFPVDEYSTVIRLAEQYLVRAEARIQQGDISGGISDLNVLRDRATDKSASLPTRLRPIDVNLSKQSALQALEHERQIELFTEWGHRWFDLKRTNRIDAIMIIEVPKKAPNNVWKSYQQRYPIGSSEIQNAPNLKQTEGYQ